MLLTKSLFQSYMDVTAFSLSLLIQEGVCFSALNVEAFLIEDIMLLMCCFLGWKSGTISYRGK